MANQMHDPLDLNALSRLISGEIPDVNWNFPGAAEWEDLIARAQAEGVAPLLYWTISNAGGNTSLPEPLQHSLRSAYAATWSQNQRIFKELEGLMQHFDEADIPAVLLKGACFALTVYPDPGLRPMGDLDLLVPESRLQEAVDIAKILGYESAVPEASPGLGALLNHAICLQKMDGPLLMVELHSRLLGGEAFTYAVPVDWFWSQVEPFDGDSRGRFGALHMLTPTAQLLYAGAHAALQHGGKNTTLRWYYDIDRLIRLYADRMDWDVLLLQARIFEWSSALDAALSQTQACFATPIPDRVRAGLSEQTDHHKKLVELQQVRPATHVLEEYQKMKALNGYGRLRLLLALIAPSPAYMRWRYQIQSRWSLPAYYLVRWWGIMMDVFRTARSFFRNQIMSMRKS
jgi:hypothetical protein